MSVEGKIKEAAGYVKEEAHEGAAESGVGQAAQAGAPKPRQAPTDRPEVGEKPVRPGR